MAFLSQALRLRSAGQFSQVISPILRCQTELVEVKDKILLFEFLVSRQKNKILISDLFLLNT